VPVTELSISDAERLRAFERLGHDALAATYHEWPIGEHPTRR